MGDAKHIRLTVRGAKRTKIQDAIHYDLVPAGVDYHRYSDGPDGCSFTVEVGGRVDVGRLYECLKKIASSIKIEAVVPEELKVKAARQEQELSSVKKQRDELKSKLERAGEDNRRLQMQLRSAEEENKKLHKRITAGQQQQQQLEGHVVYRRTDISVHEVAAKLKISGSEDGHRRRIK